jgi:outer membrane protein
MLKKLIVLFLFVAPIGVYAQEKLAYINTQEVFSSMPELKDVETKLSAKQDEIKKEMSAIQAEYDAIVKPLQESKQEPSEEVQKQLKDIEERYQTFLETSDKQFSELRQSLIAPVQQKMQKAIQEVGAEKGFTYIIEIGALPYYSSSAVDAGALVKAKLGIK